MYSWALLSFIHVFPVLIAVIPLPCLVHNHVNTWTLQQLLLCSSSLRHCNGVQDPKNHSILSYPQWKTGKPV